MQNTNPTVKSAELAKALETFTQSVSHAPATAAKQFDTYTVYSPKGIYCGNFSLPENFTEVTRTNVMAFMSSLGLEMRLPGSSKKDIDISEF